MWLSPEGCACFAVQINLSMDTHMGRRISLLQNIAALAVILAVPCHQVKYADSHLSLPLNVVTNQM